MKWTLTPVLGVTLATLTPAQEREPVRGSVERADGTPWQAATVHLLSRPLPHDERLGQADELEATVDERGRFTVELLAGREYLAWAVEELDGQQYRASMPVERVIAGRPLVLVAASPRPRRQLVFTGLDAWRDRGEVIASLISRTVPRHVKSVKLTGEEWLLPPMPGPGARLEITCDGQPLTQWPREIDLREAAGKSVKLPVPHDVKIRVTDPRARPVEGARIAPGSIDPPLGFRERRSVTASTDAAGDAVVTLPFPRGRDLAWINYAIGITARDSAPIGTIARVEIPMSHDATGAEPALRVQLEPGKSHGLRLGRGEQPFGSTVLCRTPETTSGSGSVTFGQSWRHLQPNAEGIVELSRQLDEGVLLLGLASDLRPPTELQTPLHPIAVLGAVPADADEHDIRWDLDELAPRSVAVSFERVPQHAARVAVLARLGRHLVPAVTGLTDRRGRMTVLAPPELELTYVAWTDRAFAPASKATAAPGPIALALAEVPILTGTVRDADGKPVAFATVECNVRARNEPLRALTTAIGILRIPTRRDGGFELPSFPNVTYSIRGVATPQGDHYLDREWTVGRDEPEELLLDLGDSR